MFEINPLFFSLSNGIRVVYLRKEAFVAHMGVMIQAGSRFESPAEEGLAHFIEHCIFRGTKHRSAIDVFSDLDAVGGELNAYTNKEEICIHASFRKTHFNIASELLGDILWNASFPDDELVKEKEIVLDEIISYLDSPSERIFDDFEGYLFKGNSLGYNTLGTKKSVKSFKREDLLRYIEHYFVPSNMVISVVGDFELNVLKDQLERDFGYINRIVGEESVDQPDVVAPFRIREKKSNYQTHTLIGGKAPSYNDDHRRGMTLLTNVLGGPALNSRLSLLVREQYGYAYSIESNYTSYSDIGFWSIYMGTDKKYLEKAIDLIYTELNVVCKHGLTKDELASGKEQLKGHIALTLDSNLELMFNLGKSLLFHGYIDSVAEIYQQIDSITTDEIMTIAESHFSRENMSELIYEY